MSVKRSQRNTNNAGVHKRHKSNEINDYFEVIIKESGLKINAPPEKCVASQEIIYVIRNIKKALQADNDYPRNLSEFYLNFQKRCEDMTVFKHYLFPNIIMITTDTEHNISDSVLKILLSVPKLQNKLIDYVFEKAIDLVTDSDYGPWIQMILKCFSTLDNIEDSKKIATNLINLLEITSDKMVRLEIITAIPDIIGDQAHENIAEEMSRILSEDHSLIPAILECLSYLCLSDEQYENLQKKTLNILSTISKCSHFPNFIKFLLIPGRSNENAYFEAVLGIRNTLIWPTSLATPQDIASSQILTASAIRNSIVSSKVIANAWTKVISNSKVNTDHKPIDIVITVILFSTTDEKQKQIETIIKKQIKLNILSEDIIDEAFEKYKPILKEYLKHLVSLTNTLLKNRAEPLIQNFASHMYTLMFSKLGDCCQTLVAELLQLGLDSKQCVMNILTILNNVAKQDISVLKPQSLQMLTLLDRTDEMNLSEIRAVMNLICGLAYSCENSVIRDDIHMIIRKELGSSNPTIKIQGILAGVHAVKYLMASQVNEDQSIDTEDDISYSSVNHLPEGDLKEAAQIIELISRSTRQFPDMIAFFYDELCKVLQCSSYINKLFLKWMIQAVTNDLHDNFIVDDIENKMIKNLQLNMQYCLNTDSEMEGIIAINIAGITLQTNEDINIIILSPLFQLVQTLYSKDGDGSLTEVDALLGCPVVMPIFEIESIEEMNNTQLTDILDCLVHCVNWFRELLNAFASQNVALLKSKMLNRILHVQKLEELIGQILITSNITYKPPACSFNVRGNTAVDQIDRKNVKVQTGIQKAKKAHDESAIPDMLKSQLSQHNIAVKAKISAIQNLPLRPLNFKVYALLKGDLRDDDELEKDLNIEVLSFLLKHINNILENVMLSKIKKKTVFSKQEDIETYDRVKAEEHAKCVNEVLPKMMEHLKYITTYLDRNLIGGIEEQENLFDEKKLLYLSTLESIFSMFTIYFKWIGFKNHHKSLFKSSLRTIVNSSTEDHTSVQKLLLDAGKHLQNYEKYCVQLSTAVSLIEFYKALMEYTSDSTLRNILIGLAKNILSKQWKAPDGSIEKGILFNQNIDNVARVYLINNNVSELKSITLLLVNDLEEIKKIRNSALKTFPCINKSNFSTLYKNLITALHEATVIQLNKGMTNTEHLDLWKDAFFILKNLSEIAMSHIHRNNYVAFFKIAPQIIKLFFTNGFPIIEIEFKNKTQVIMEILKTLQKSTRFLHTLCNESRLKKDKTLISKTPFVKEVLEINMYRVKAVLASNNCSEAFWMGTLLNKNIHGDEIISQQTVNGEDTIEEHNGTDLEDEDEEDDDSDDGLNPDSSSVIL